MEVGDALVGVDHGELRAIREGLVERCADLCAVLEVLEACEDRAEAIVGAEASCGELLTVLLEHVGEERLDDVAEDDRVGDLHHRRLEVSGEEDVSLLRLGDLGLEELGKLRGFHLGGVDHFTLEHIEVALEDGLGAVGSDVLDRQDIILVEDDGLLVGAEIAFAHRGDCCLGISGPCTHAVGVLAGVALHGFGSATIRVAFTQHRVDCRALDDVVLGLDGALFVVLGILRVIGDVEALLLQLLDGRLELRHRCRDVGQLDDVGFRRLRQLAQLAQRIVLIGELREDAGCDGDVAGFDLHARLLGECFDDREEGIGGEQGGLVGEGVDDLAHVFGDAPRQVDGLFGLSLAVPPLD